MRGLQSKPAKTAIIAILSLIAAVVCFGLLRSSGVVNNGYVELGGAFVGFVVSVVLLNRVWGKEETTEDEAGRVGADFLFEEVVKILDLRKARLQDETQLAPLTDYYRVRRLGTASTVESQYGATTAVSFVESPTHPSAKWRWKKPDHPGPRGEELKEQFTLTVDLEELGKGEVTPIVHNLMYTNAFKSPDGEWLETHLEYPTRHLTMVVLAPDGMRITGATGGQSLARGRVNPTPEQPTIIQDRSVIYWSIEGPVVSTRYALSWEWAERAVTSHPD